MIGPRSVPRATAPLILGAALFLLGPTAPTTRAQWFGAPGFGGPFGGLGYGVGGFHGGFGYGIPWAGFGGPYGYGANPYAFSVLHQPNVQAGLAYNSLATGRLAPFTYGAAPFGYGQGGALDYGLGPFGYGGAYGYGFGPFGYAGTAFSNPYFASGLTPLAVQSALEEQVLSRALAPTRVQYVPIIVREPAPADPAPAPEEPAADPDAG